MVGDVGLRAALVERAEMRMGRWPGFYPWLNPSPQARARASSNLRSRALRVSPRPSARRQDFAESPDYGHCSGAATNAF
jgi:hypothetical protein